MDNLGSYVYYIFFFAFDFVLWVSSKFHSLLLYLGLMPFYHSPMVLRGCGQFSISLTILRPGCCQVAVKCSTNSCTCVHIVYSFVQLGQQNNSSPPCKINTYGQIDASLCAIRSCGQNEELLRILERNAKPSIANPIYRGIPN